MTRSRFVLLVLVFRMVLPAFGAGAEPLAIRSLAVEGSNLVFTAAVPDGLERITLEMRPAFDQPWEAAGEFSVPAGGGELKFTTPIPSASACFFRLSARSAENAAALASGEFEYVATASLAAKTENGDAV